MENPFAEMLAALDRPNYGKLSFDEQCGYYAALVLHLDPAKPLSPKDRRPIPPAVVAKASGLSQATVSLLAAAGEIRGGQLRYPKVANEYRALGHEAFVHRYLTAPIREAIVQGLDAMSRKAKADPDIVKLGYSPRATRYCFRYEWLAASTSSGRHTVFRIELHPTLGGYFWRDLKPFTNEPEVPYDRAAYHPACMLVGDPSRGPERGPSAKGFPTSEACYRHVKNLYNPRIEADAR